VFEEGDATRTNVGRGLGQKSYLFLVFCPKRDLKNRLKEEKKVSQKKKKERKRRKPSFLKKERMILIVADVVVEKIFFTPRYFTHSLRKRSRSMNCKA